MSHANNKGSKIEDFDCIGQSSIDARQRELEARHSAYLQEHPELGEVLQDFMQSLLIHKPDDALAYTSQYFKDIHLLPDGTDAAATTTDDAPVGAGAANTTVATTEEVDEVRDEYLVADGVLSTQV